MKTQTVQAHTDQNLIFLRQLLRLYQELITHDGYGELSINISQINGNQKQVKLQCGKEYTYNIHLTNRTNPNRYKIVDTAPHIYSGPERRTNHSRRKTNHRRKNNEPRNFRLERRLEGDRRTGHERRHND